MCCITNDEDKKCCRWSACTATIVGLLIFMIVMIALSVQNVAQDEWAINWRRVLNRPSGDILGPGRTTVQPDSHLIRYPNTFMQEDSVLTCYTMDGVVVTLTSSTQVRYIPSEIITVLHEFGTHGDFAPYIQLNIERLIRVSCSNFSYNDFYSNRGLVQDDMFSRISNDLPLRNTHLSIGGYFQLRNIQLPDEINAAISSVQIAQNNITLANNQRNQSLTIAETQLNQALNQKQIILNNATFQASAILYGAQQQAQGIAVQYDKLAQAYIIGMQALGTINGTQYTELLYASLLESSSGTVFVN